MNRIIVLGILAFGWTTSLPGQAKKELTLNTDYLGDHAQTRGFMLGRPMKAQPTPDAKSVLFLRSGPRQAKLSLFEFDVASKETRELLTPEQVLQGAVENLTAEEKARRERMRVSVGGFTSFQMNEDGSLILVSLSGRLYSIERASKKIRELEAGPGGLLDPKFSPDGKMVSYVRNHDVYVFHLAANKETRVTTGGTDMRSNGLAEFVAQEEMGRFTGYWWSPDSKHLAYEHSDAKDVEIWHVADPIHPDQKPAPFFYPRPGKANVDVKLGVIPVEGGETVWIVWDKVKWPYLTTVKWKKHLGLLVTVQNREQTEVSVHQADPKTGTTTPLLVEREETWVNLNQDIPYSMGERGFFWISEIDDAPQLEVRQPNGRRSSVAVPAREGFQAIVDYNADEGGVLHYLASPDPTQSHLYRVNLKKDYEPTKLTKEEGLHAATFSPNHAIYVLNSRLKDGMPRSTVHQADGTLIGELPSVAEEPPFKPLVEYRKIGPGEGFFAAVPFPRTFDPKKKYPVMVDVYGGPHHLHVASSQNRWLLDQWYADQGFMVVALDGRGTPGRGRKWERAIHKKFGSVPLEDQVAGLKALGELYPNLDLTRVGIDGWSFGGYLSALAVLRRPDVFHAAVAGAPVTDWYDYDTHYTERYLGVPPRDAAAYDDASLLTYAKDLRRPLMILHGTADDNVYFRHSLKLVDALFRQGKDFEMVPLSGLTHMVPNPEVMQRLHARIAGFFQKNLGGPVEWK